MSQLKKHKWRAEIDTIIDEELLLAGFQTLDSYAFSVPVADEFCGVLHIENQELAKGPVSSIARIRPRLGVCHVQLEALASHLCPAMKPLPPRKYNWTVDSGDSTRPQIRICTAGTSLKNKNNSGKKEISWKWLVSEMKTFGTAFIVENFGTIEQIQKYLLKYDETVRYPILLVLLGKTEEAMDHVWKKISRII